MHIWGTDNFMEGIIQCNAYEGTRLEIFSIICFYDVGHKELCGQVTYFFKMHCAPFNRGYGFLSDQANKTYI